MPDCPSLGEPRKCCTETHAYVLQGKPRLKCFAQWNPAERTRLSPGLLGRREAIKHRRLGEAVCTYKLISEVLAAMEKTRLLLFFLCKIIWGSLESAKRPDPPYAQRFLDTGTLPWASVAVLFDVCAHCCCWIPNWVLMRLFYVILHRDTENEVTQWAFPESKMSGFKSVIILARFCWLEDCSDGM